MSFTILRRSPLAELAARQLHDRLTSGQWPVGSRLPTEIELAEQLGVGRSTVREAIRALVHAGMLETRQGSGTFVRSLAPDASWQTRLRRAAILEVYEVREALEIQAARLAAERRTATDLMVLRASLGALDGAREQAHDSRSVEADLALHRAVVAAAHNLLLAEMYDSFACVLREALVAVITDEALDAVTLAPAHARLVAAIEAADPDAAEQAIREHLRSSSAVLRKLAAPPAPADPPLPLAPADPPAPATGGTG